MAAFKQRVYNYLDSLEKCTIRVEVWKKWGERKKDDFHNREVLQKIKTSNMKVDKRIK